MQKKSKKINSNNSKYARAKLINSKDEGLVQDDEFDEQNDVDEQNDSDQQGEVDEQDDFNDNSSEDFDDNESTDFDNEAVAINKHLRSNGLVSNVWWKKGLLKGFLAWIVIVLIFYLFDIFGLVEVIDWKRWLFFLFFLLIIGLTYDKFKLNKILKI